MSEEFKKYGFPDGKRYSSFVGYFKRKYGERLQKIVLDAGFTCPNRDGKVGRGGCTYCDNAAFHPSYSTAGKSLYQQMEEVMVLELVYIILMKKLENYILVRLQD